jgi:4-carboxymuconolactone decarboxylase
MASDDAANERRDRGLAAYGSQLGLSADEAGDWFRARYGDRFAEEAINAAGGAWVDDSLSRRDRSLIVVAALVTLGDVEERLRTHVRWALEHGSSRAELEALVTLLAVYVGFPRASVAMEVVRDELARADGAGAAD